MASIRVRVYRFDKTFQLLEISEEAQKLDHKTKRNRKYQEILGDLIQYLGASESKLIRIKISKNKIEKNKSISKRKKSRAMWLCLLDEYETRRVSA